MQSYGKNVTRSGRIIRATINLDGNPTDDLAWIMTAIQEAPPDEGNEPDDLVGYFLTVLLSQHLDNAEDIASEFMDTVLAAVEIATGCTTPKQAKQSVLAWMHGTDLAKEQMK